MDNQLRKNIIQLNELSKDIYGEERRLSVILTKAGFGDAEVTYLQGTGLSQFMDNLDLSLRASLFTYSSGEKLFYVLYHRYGLFGYEKQTLETIGKRYGDTREWIRKLEEKALRYLRRGVFETDVILSACKVLNVDIYDMLVVNIPTPDEISKLKSSKKKTPFAMSDEMRTQLTAVDTPISLVEFMRALNSTRPMYMKNLKRKYVVEFLLNSGILEEYVKDDGKLTQIPTDEGCALGVSTEERMGYRGTYLAVLYNNDAQQFLIDNIDAIIQLQNEG